MLYCSLVEIDALLSIMMLIIYGLVSLRSTQINVQEVFFFCRIFPLMFVFGFYIDMDSNGLSLAFLPANSTQKASALGSGILTIDFLLALLFFFVIYNFQSIESVLLLIFAFIGQYYMLHSIDLLSFYIALEAQNFCFLVLCGLPWLSCSSSQNRSATLACSSNRPAWPSCSPNRSATLACSSNRAAWPSCSPNRTAGARLLATGGECLPFTPRAPHQTESNSKSPQFNTKAVPQQQARASESSASAPRAPQKNALSRNNWLGARPTTNRRLATLPTPNALTLPVPPFPGPPSAFAAGGPCGPRVHLTGPHLSRAPGPTLCFTEGGPPLHAVKRGIRFSGWGGLVCSGGSGGFGGLWSPRRGGGPTEKRSPLLCSPSGAHPLLYRGWAPSSRSEEGNPVKLMGPPRELIGVGPALVSGVNVPVEKSDGVTRRAPHSPHSKQYVFRGAPGNSSEGGPRSDNMFAPSAKAEGDPRAPLSPLLCSGENVGELRSPRDGGRPPHGPPLQTSCLEWGCTPPRGASLPVGGVHMWGGSRSRVIANGNYVMSVEATIKYFLLSAFSSGVLLFWFSAIYLQTGMSLLSFSPKEQSFSSAYTFSTDFFDHDSFAGGSPALECGGSLESGGGLSMFLILCAMMFKIGAAPLHLWVVQIYNGVRRNLLLYISTAPKLCFFGFWVNTFQTVWTDYSVILFCCFSIVMGAFGAYNQPSIRSLLAYSTINEIGLLLAALETAGFNSLFQHLSIYTISQILLWNLSDKRLFIILAVSLSGLPPLAGFFGKSWIFWHIGTVGLTSVLLIGLVCTGVSLVYYLRIIRLYWNPRSNTRLSFDIVNRSMTASTLNKSKVELNVNLLSTAGQGQRVYLTSACVVLLIILPIFVIKPFIL